MGIDFTILMIFLYILTIDFLARLVQKQSRDQTHFKPPGLVAQGLLAIFKRPTDLKNKNASLRRFALTLATSAILLFSLTQLLKNQIINDQKPLLFLALLPVFALPFYHLIYGCQTTSFVTMQASLAAFRLRGILSILLVGNIVFLQAEPTLSLTGILAHSLCAFLSLVCSFYLCSQKLQKPSPFNFGKIEDLDCGPPAFLHYFVSCLEVCFYIILFSLIFLQPHLPLIENLPAWAYNDKFLIFSTLFALALLTKIFFYLRAPWTLEFFEETLLPLSFILFAAISLLQTNF